MFMTSVRDVMSTPVITVGPDAPLKEVAQLLVQHRVSGVPVVAADGRVLGLISETDLVLKAGGSDAVHHRPFARVVGESEAAGDQMAKVNAMFARDAMTAPAIVVAPDRSVHDAAALMASRRVNRLPVVDANGGLLGIVSRADIVRAFVRPDEDLARTIRENVVIETMWLDPDRIEVSVVDGVAHVRGTLDRRSTTEILIRLIGQVDGVVAVQAELTWKFDDHHLASSGDPSGHL